MSNSGKISEAKFEKWCEQLGYLHRFEDLFDALKKGKAANQRPSDYLATIEGTTHYCEVKSTGKKSLAFSAITPSQWKTATKVTKHNGTYFFFIHFLDVDKWFAVPARVLLNHDKQSININLLDRYEFDINEISSEPFSFVA